MFLLSWKCYEIKNFWSIYIKDTSRTWAKGYNEKEDSRLLDGNFKCIEADTRY